MYEVFFYASRLIIAGSEARDLLVKGEAYRNIKSKEDVILQVEKFLSGQHSLIFLLGDPEAVWSWFRSCFQEIPAAGGIVRSNSGILFIHRRGKWDLPKGKIEIGEKSEYAAVREVCEETGVRSVRIIRNLPSTWHIYYNNFNQDDRLPILKETTWYLMESSDEQNLVPESEEDIECVKWFRQDELHIVEQNTFANLLPLIKLLKQVND